MARRALMVSSFDVPTGRWFLPDGELDLSKYEEQVAVIVFGSVTYFTLSAVLFPQKTLAEIGTETVIGVGVGVAGIGAQIWWQYFFADPPSAPPQAEGGGATSGGGGSSNLGVPGTGRDGAPVDYGPRLNTRGECLSSCYDPAGNPQISMEYGGGFGAACMQNCCQYHPEAPGCS